MSAAPTHRKGSMPKNGGPMRQRVSHHGTKPTNVPGARMKNTSDPREAQKRRMGHPNDALAGAPQSPGAAPTARSEHAVAHREGDWAYCTFECPSPRCLPRSAVLVPFVALQSFSQSLCDEKGVGGLLQAPDLAVSQCPEMGESGLHPPPLLRN